MVKKTVSIKVGCKTYNVSNSCNSLFICGSEEVRKMTALSVFEQLKNEKNKDKVEVKLISQNPEDYSNGISGGFEVDLIDEYIKEMERRYDLIAESESKNYINYNQHHTDKAMKLHVLVIDGVEVVADNPKYARFFESLHILVKKSRGAGIHVITFVKDLPSNRDDLFKYYVTPVHVMRKGFFMKEATNIIMKELYSSGFSPILNLSYDKDEGTIWIGINLEVCDVHLSFSFNYDAHSVSYALLFPIDLPLDFDTKMEIYRTLRTDVSQCYDGFSDDYYEGHLSITGSRWASQITPQFIQCMIEEIRSLRVVEKLKLLQKA